MFVLAIGALGILAVPTLGQSGIKIHGQGTVTEMPGGASTLTMKGTASHLGQYTCYAEIDFVPGVEVGSQDGIGVGVFTAANGDLLAGIVTFHMGADGNSEIHFSWRDSVKFND